jgi:ABC-type transport system involved in cytochrome c biogenesis permease subunit
MEVMTSPTLDPTLAIADVRSLENAARSVTDEVAFRNQLISLRENLAKRADARGEYKSIPLEAQYYHINWFLYALVFFLIGTIAALGMWTFGKGKVSTALAWATFIPTLTGLIFCVVAITKRSLIMHRPPVGNLYDTIIFIGATVVMLALIVEWFTKKRFALGIAPILGTLLIVLARRYELGDAKDHMDPLVAVLDSNFWLTTHVITITLGYSAGLLAAFLACGYLMLRGLRLDGGNKDLRRSLTKAVYGMICLTLFLSLIGTVLGGIWANYSWGRFWGWDPKENGALLIVLWTLSILHARLGGYIKEWGINLAAAFTAIVVTFSWWHVNFLGVGLHNYGFTAGKDTIWMFYGVMVGFLAFGFIAMFMERMEKSQKVVKQPSSVLDPAKV